MKESPAEPSLLMRDTVSPLVFVFIEAYRIRVLAQQANGRCILYCRWEEEDTSRMGAEGEEIL
jgi:hypothetical protein